MTINFEHFSSTELEELRKVFYSQAYEIVENLQESLLKLENDIEDAAALKTIKRYVHTLKGDSNSFSLTSIGTLCHSMEDILSLIMDNSQSANHEAVDLLLNCVEIINRLLLESEAGSNGTRIEEITEKIETFKMGNYGRPETHDKAAKITHTEYQRLQIENSLKNGLNVFNVEIVFDPGCGEKNVGALMAAQRLNSMGEVIQSLPDIESGDFGQAERMNILFSTKLAGEEVKRDAFIAGITYELNISNFKENSGISAIPCLEPETPNSKMKSEMLRIEVSKVDRIINLVGELIIGRSMIDQIAKDIENGNLTNDMTARIFTANSYMERTVSDLQKGVMKMRMVPINNVFRRFPKVVRDLSMEKGKKVRLDIRGRETELDKGIVDVLGEPLSHIIRNSIDHGIEESASRKSAGKPEEATITMRAYHEASHIVIEVEDDGRGLDVTRIKEKAVERGFFTGDEADKLSDKDAFNLIFLSGLSTSETISETSGRGVGMDVVKSAIEGMKGTVEVESTVGKGTRFILRLPLTLAVIKALLFEVGEKLYAIPISVIAEVTRVFKKDLVTVDGRDTLMLRDKIISMIHLRKLFGTGLIKNDYDSKRFALTFNIGGGSIGLLIDRLAGQQELVIKAVDECYAQSGLVSGASILGDGRVVLILNAPAIYKKAVEDERKRMAAV